MKNKPCCEKCENNIGGGATMLPLIRGCKNLDCPCHHPAMEKCEHEIGIVKDSKVGARAYCKKCGKEATPPSQEEWNDKDEFGDLFSKIFQAVMERLPDDSTREAKGKWWNKEIAPHFRSLKSLIDSTRKEERERVKEKVEGMKKGVNPEHDCSGKNVICNVPNCIYNSALDDFLSLLS